MEPWFCLGKRKMANYECAFTISPLTTSPRKSIILAQIDGLFDHLKGAWYFS
jgi:ribosome-associated toxin RatA of RatAB toxin-antitoxin module